MWIRVSSLKYCCLFADLTGEIKQNKIKKYVEFCFTLNICFLSFWSSHDNAAVWSGRAGNLWFWRATLMLCNMLWKRNKTQQGGGWLQGGGADPMSQSWAQRGLYGWHNRPIFNCHSCVPPLKQKWWNGFQQLLLRPFLLNWTFFWHFRWNGETVRSPAQTGVTAHEKSEPDPRESLCSSSV